MTDTVRPVQRLERLERLERPRRLVLPVSLLMAVSVVIICGLVWLNAHTLNESARQTSLQLAQSMLSAKRERLEVLAYDYTWWDDAIANLVTTFDQTWAADNIGSYLTETYGIASSFALSANDRTIVGFVDGEASELDLYDRFSKDLAQLVFEARGKPMEQPSPVSGYMEVGGEIHVVAVAALTPEYPTEEQLRPHARPVLVLSVPLDEAYLRKAGAEYHLADLHLAQPGAATSEPGLELRAVDGAALARLGWLDERPGARLLDQLWPALAATLIGMSALLYFAFRDAGRVVERQAGLVSLLERERELRALRSRFVSLISHELRTPLSSIRSSVELLGTYGERMSAEERSCELDKIDRAAQRLTRLAENALPFGRSEASDEVWQFHSVDLAAVCREVWQEAVRVCGATHRLELRVGSQQPRIVTDEVVVRVILSNLFQNAILYSPNGDAVDVEIASTAGETRIEVTDFGPGIGEDELHRIFEPFQRGRSAAGREGSGMGLAIARSMAESLGGRLTVENARDAGARFAFVLPDPPPGRRPQ